MENVVRIQYADLVAGPKGIGTPFVAGGRDPSVGLDCKAVAYIAMRRAGLDVPDCPVLGAEETDGESARAYLDGYLAQGDRWAEVESPYRVGDLVLSETPDGPHASVVCDTSPLQVITATRDLGVVVHRLSAVAGDRRVLRWT